MRKFARELGVDLHAVRGTGRNARIFRSDVQAFVKARIAAPVRPAGAGAGLDLPPWPKIDFAKFGDFIERFRDLPGVVEIVGHGGVRAPFGEAQEVEVAVLLASNMDLPEFDARRDVGVRWIGCGQLDLLGSGSRWRRGAPSREYAQAQRVSAAFEFVRDERLGEGLVPQPNGLRPFPSRSIANSDHPNCQGGYGPSWVAALVNAIGESKFWDSTAIFVQWDDWGSLYDPVPPPLADYDGLGFRVPLLVISPYAKHGYVSHKRYETASVLRFAEDLWGLAQLAAADRRANSPALDCFDFAQKPRTFVRIPAPKGRGFFLHQGDDRRIPDDQ